MAVKISSGNREGETLTTVGESIRVHDEKGLLLVGARANIEGDCFVWFTEKNRFGFGLNNEIFEVEITPENSPIQHEYCGVTATATYLNEPLRQRGGLVS